ncbi:YdiK family protein [Salipaludibacillus daqingensis]|uniref:YdiK family protein n=1 Tax=Salipaludibacillus daqingensis TaxID=3041001 RepID=UPI0024744AA0|nr:YdiK family protein [Salipaludibacillus daqingensis]
MIKPSRFHGYMYFFLGTLFLYFAIQSAQQSSGWDFFTILLIAFAAIDYMIAFRTFGAIAKQQQDKKQ